MGFFFFHYVISGFDLIKNKMTNFKQLKIWIKSMEIATLCFNYFRSLSPSEKIMIGTQITKSAISIPSNIAEGSSRQSQKDYYRFIEIATGSSYELETQILLSEAGKFGDELLRKQILEMLIEEQKMLKGFAMKLKQ